MPNTREKLEVIAHLGDHITYREGIGICYDSVLAKVIEDAYMTLKDGVTVQEEPQAHADAIRAMSDEELARFLASKFTDETYYRLTKKAHIPTATEIEAIRNYWYDTWLAWLKQPAEGD